MLVCTGILRATGSGKNTLDSSMSTVRVPAWEQRSKERDDLHAGDSKTAGPGKGAPGTACLTHENVKYIFHCTKAASSGLGPQPGRCELQWTLMNGQAAVGAGSGAAASSRVRGAPLLLHGRLHAFMLHPHCLWHSG